MLASARGCTPVIHDETHARDVPTVGPDARVKVGSDAWVTVGPNADIDLHVCGVLFCVVFCVCV